MSQPPPPPEEGLSPRYFSEQEKRRQWRMTRVFCATLLALYVLDVLILKRPSLAPLLVRLAWVTEMSVYTWLLVRTPEHRLPLLRSLHGVLISTCFLGLVSVTGGSNSPYMAMVPSLPLLMALIQPQEPKLAILCGVTGALGMLVILPLTNGQALNTLAWVGTVGAATFFGVYGSEQYRKAQVAENEARVERARRESMEKLTKAERYRAQTEKLATVGRLAASVMHEINNPLSFVGSNLAFLRTEVLAQPLPEKERQEFQEAFDETRSGVERIKQIVLDLKGFSRMDDEEPSECALADVVTDAARLAAVRLKHVARLKVEIPAELPEVFATRRRLAQVLLNLLVNAGDALEEAKVQGGEVRVTGVAEEGRVTLLVEDNGPGFPPEVLPRLFESFFTTKGPEKGTGLGLSISRELVERFGGTLKAENRPEGGARLRLELPVHKSAPSGTHEQA
ncbi:sensor histidine kinase [Archangium lansingense]|uniref:histidine kinase n=1 Tax=Archangium lansingense TaxID=2995310 RepID=A0ABT4APD2_9BACT|nr:ATP-binding protein [Archangium lansinium]MCY1083551.1 ATP-binding protein [Archangium lansinium]